MNETILYYSVLHINGTRIISQIPNNPFIFDCDFTNSGLTITQRKKDNSLVFHYNEIQQIDVFVCSRLVGPIISIPSLQYNFDLVVYTNKNKSFHIEIAATSKFKEVIDILNKANVNINDKLNIFPLFNDKDNFRSNYYDYMNVNFKTLAKQYRLDNPRMNYTLKDS